MVPAGIRPERRGPVLSLFLSKPRQVQGAEKVPYPRKVGKVNWAAGFLVQGGYELPPD